MTDTTTCYHESGHAVVGFLLGGEIQQMNLGGDADEQLPQRFGDCRIAWPAGIAAGISDDKHRRREILTLVAGPVAEQIYAGHDFEITQLAASLDDIQRAGRLARQLSTSSAAADRLLRQSVTAVRRMLADDHIWAAVAALADELDAHEALENDAIASVIEFWLSR